MKIVCRDQQKVPIEHTKPGDMVLYSGYYYLRVASPPSHAHHSVRLYVVVPQSGLETFFFSGTAVVTVVPGYFLAHV